MYFMHRFYWKQWEDVAAVNDANTQLNIYKTNVCKPKGKSMNSVMDEIKVIYP